MTELLDTLRHLGPQDGRFQMFEEWIDGGEHAQNPFQQFFFYYIALVIASRMNNSTSPEERAVKDLLRGLQAETPTILSSCEGELLWFAQRSDRTMLNDAADPEPLARLKAHVLGSQSVGATQLAQGIAVLLIQVRNNLFHGNKVYRESTDLEVLNRAVPIVRSVLSAFANVAQQAGRTGT